MLGSELCLLSLGVSSECSESFIQILLYGAGGYRFLMHVNSALMNSNG